MHDSIYLEKRCNEKKDIWGGVLCAFHLLVSEESEHRDDSNQGHHAEDRTRVTELSCRIEQERFGVIQDQPCRFASVGFGGLKAIQENSSNRQGDKAYRECKRDIHPSVSSTVLHSFLPPKKLFSYILMDNKR